MVRDDDVAGEAAEVRDLGEDPLTEQRMPLELAPLALVERSLLQEHDVGDADLAHVVEERRDPQARPHVLCEPQAPGQEEGVRGDVLRMELRYRSFRSISRRVKMRNR